MAENYRLSQSEASRVPRQRPSPPDVAARNLAIERKRRGALNDNFLELARLVPALAPTRRLSKVLILNSSIRHFQQQRDMCISAAQDMQDLVMENRQLISELNALRSQIWGPDISACEPKPVTEAMAQLMSVQDEVYGEFQSGFGYNWACNSAESQSSETPVVSPEDEESGPPQNDVLQTQEMPHHIQAPVHHEPATLYNENTGLLIASEPQKPSLWAFDPSQAPQMNPMLSSYSAQFTSVDPTPENYSPAEMP